GAASACVSIDIHSCRDSTDLEGRPMLRRHGVFRLALVATVSLLMAGPSRAQWVADGVPVVTASGAQGNVRIAAAGAGSTILTWDAARPGAPGVYAQKLDGLGMAQWAGNGILVSATGQKPRVISDGAGGAIIAWRDFRAGANGV